MKRKILIDNNRYCRLMVIIWLISIHIYKYYAHPGRISRWKYSTFFLVHPLHVKVNLKIFCNKNENHLPNLLFFGHFQDKHVFFYRKWICNWIWMWIIFYYLRWIPTMLHLVVKDAFYIPSTWLGCIRFFTPLSNYNLKILQFVLLISDVEKIILCLVIFSWLSNTRES